jgi:hypothetical protein
MKSDKLEAEAILEILAQMRKSLPPFERNARRPSEDTRTRFKGDLEVETEEDLEWAAVIDAVESLADDVQTMVDQKRARLFQDCLKIYYAMEERIDDPEHAHLIPLVEQMREAYQRDFGRPIPPKGK